MTNKERKVLKDKIETTILQLEEDMRGLKEQTAPISPENAIGLISRMDAINSKSVAEDGLRRAQNKMNKLQVALSKIDSPDFGICSRCGGPIQAGRLMFMPESTRCIHCADK